MTLAPLQLPIDRSPDEGGSVLAFLKYGFDPAERPLREPGLHILGPHLFASHVIISHMRY